MITYIIKIHQDFFLKFGYEIKNRLRCDFSRYNHSLQPAVLYIQQLLCNIKFMTNYAVLQYYNIITLQSSFTKIICGQNSNLSK